MSRRESIVIYSFHFFNVITFVFNAVLMVENLNERSYWYAALSATSALLIFCVEIYHIRKHRRFARQVRDDDLLIAEQLSWYFHPSLLRAPALGRTKLPHWMAQQQLDNCLVTNTCPDCGEQSLDKKSLTCISSGCGSRFARSPTGEWSRL